MPHPVPNSANYFEQYRKIVESFGAGYTVRMLSLFPEILFLAPIATFLLRVALSLIFAYSAWTRVPSERTSLKVFGAVDALLAVMLIVGFYTQLAALIAALCLIYWLIKSDMSPFPRSTSALALVIAVSLIVMGSGPFAFDLPL